MRTVILLLYFLALGSCTDTGKNAAITEQANRAKEEEIATFNWQTELCDKQGTYNPDKYNAKQLKDTYELWFTYMGLDLNVQTDFSPQELSAFKSSKVIAVLEEEYTALKNKYESLDVVPLPLFENLRKRRLQTLDERYYLYKIILESYDNPQVLLKNKFSADCLEFGEALSSPDTLALLSAWKRMIDNDIQEGSLHKDAYATYQQEYNSKDRLAHARTHILTYGWYNCANSRIPDPDNEANYREEFEKLFLSISSECDEP